METALPGCCGSWPWPLTTGRGWRASDRGRGAPLERRVSVRGGGRDPASGWEAGTPLTGAAVSAAGSVGSS